MESHHRTSGGLPYSESLARCFKVFDLPYGAVMGEVTRRYEEYLNKCDPDRHTKDPEKLIAAYQLTGILTWAHGEIKAAWRSQHSSKATGLKFDTDVARCYKALDLPFGAPMDEVTRRWKIYLKKCHPDRYAQDETMLPDATRLTQLLTQAYEKIKKAWLRHSGTL